MLSVISESRKSEMSDTSRLYMSVFLPPYSSTRTPVLVHLLGVLQRLAHELFLRVLEFSDHRSQRVAIGFNVLGDVLRP